MIRTLIADDQALVRGGFRMILDHQPDIEVIGEAQDGRAAVTRALELHPDVILMDIRMPELDGIQATAELARARSTARVLMLKTFDLDEYVYAAMKAGASGFLLKDVDPPDLAAAVRGVARGDALLSPTLTRRLIEHFGSRPAPCDGPTRAIADLTAREIDVLRLIAQGRSNAEIARELYLAEPTIKTHITKMLGKLGLRDRVQAVVFAYESGSFSRAEPRARSATGRPTAARWGAPLGQRFAARAARRVRGHALTRRRGAQAPRRLRHPSAVDRGAADRQPRGERSRSCAP